MTTCTHPITIVIDTRPCDGYIRRRRKCLDCKERWSTLEIPYNFTGTEKYGTVITSQQMKAIQAMLEAFKEIEG